MAKNRAFTTLPVAAIGDDRLHAVDLRVLAAIALHDGMSLVRGTGGGCYAKHKTLAEEVGIDYARFSKSLRRLREFGYVQVEEQSHDRRRKTMRVPYPKDGSRPAAPEIVGAGDNHLVDMVDNETGEIVVKRESGKPANSGVSKPLIYSVKQELDLAEAREIDSIEMAHRGDAGCNEEDVSNLVNATIGSLGHRSTSKQLPSSGIALRTLLPQSFTKLPVDAQLDHWERALKLIDWCDDRIIENEMSLMRQWLEDSAIQLQGSKTGARAQRMLERLWEQDEALAELHTVNGSAVCRA